MSDNDYDLKVGANVDGATAEFNKLSNDAEKSAKKIQEVMQQASYKMAEVMQESSEKIKGSFESVGQAFEKINKLMIGFAAIAGGGAAFKEAVDASVNLTKESVSLGKSFGISATQASVLKVAMGDVYLSQETVAAANQKLTKTLDANPEAFKKLGVATRDASGNLRNSFDIMLDTNTALLKFKEGIDRNTEGQRIYGKSWGEVQGVLKLNADLMEESKKKAEALGLVVGQENVEATAKYRAAMNDMHDVMDAVMKVVGDALLPMLTKMGQWFGDVGPSLLGVFKGAVDVISFALSSIWEIVTLTWGIFSDAFSAIGGLFGDLSGSSMTGSELIKNSFLVIKAAVLFVKVAVKEAFEHIKFMLMEFVAYVVNVAKVANAALHFDFAGAKAAWSQGLDEMAGIAKEHVDHMVDIAKKGKEEFDAEFFKSSAVTESKPPSGTVHSQGKDGKDKKAASRMGDWKEQLTQKLETEQSYFKDSLQAELAFWSAKLELTKKGTKERAAVEHEIFALHKKQAQDALQSDIAELKSQSEAMQAGGVERIRIAGEIAAKIGDKYGLESKEYKAALADMTKAAQEHHKQLDKLEEMRLERVKQHALSELEINRDRVKTQQAMGEITNMQALLALQKLAEDEYQIELKSAQDAADLIGNDVIARQQAYDKIAVMAEKHSLEMKKITSQVAVEQKAQWDKAFAPIGSAFEKSMNGIIQGTLTLKKALSQMFQSIALEFANIGVKMVVQWVSDEARKTMATAEGTQSRSMMETIAASESSAVGGMAAVKNIMNSAYEAMAGAYKAIVGIPFIGPALAPVVAAGAFTAVAGLAGSVASAEGGYDIPSGLNPMTQLHEKEMVLPAKHAEVIRGMADGNGSGGNGSGGAVHKVDARARCVERTGWHDGSFVMPNKTVGNHQQEKIIFQSAANTQSTFKQKGKLSDWQNNISKPCEGNSRLVFAISAAFASPLLEVTGRRLHNCIVKLSHSRSKYNVACKIHGSLLSLHTASAKPSVFI